MQNSFSWKGLVAWTTLPICLHLSSLFLLWEDATCSFISFSLALEFGLPEIGPLFPPPQTTPRSSHPRTPQRKRERERELFPSPYKRFVSFLSPFSFEVTYLARKLSLVPCVALLLVLALNRVKRMILSPGAKWINVELSFYVFNLEEYFKWLSLS